MRPLYELNKMRRRDAIGWLNLAANARRNAVSLMKISPELAASFISEARKNVAWARADFGYARAAGWKLP